MGQVSENKHIFQNAKTCSSHTQHMIPYRNSQIHYQHFQHLFCFSLSLFDLKGNIPHIVDPCYVFSFHVSSTNILAVN